LIGQQKYVGDDLSNQPCFSTALFIDKMVDDAVFLLLPGRPDVTDDSRPIFPVKQELGRRYLHVQELQGEDWQKVWERPEEGNDTESQKRRVL
jgi:hypothetical protein